MAIKLNGTEYSLTNTARESDTNVPQCIADRTMAELQADMAESTAQIASLANEANAIMRSMTTKAVWQIRILALELLEKAEEAELIATEYAACNYEVAARAARN